MMAANPRLASARPNGSVALFSAWLEVTRHGAGHVRDAIVHDAIDLIGRIRVRRRARRLKTSALVDGHVDQHGTVLHGLQHLARDQFRRARAWNQYGSDHNVGREHFLFDRLHGRKPRSHAPREHLVQLAEPRNRAVEDRYFRSEAGRHACGMRSDHTAADHHDAGRLNAGYASDEQAAATVESLERRARPLRSKACRRPRSSGRAGEDHRACR